MTFELNIVTEAPPPKPAAKKPAGVSAAPKVRPAPKPINLTAEQVGTYGVASIFAGTFLLTLAILPGAVENALELIGVGYTGFLIFNAGSRQALDNRLVEIDDATGINLKAVATTTVGAVGDLSKTLAKSADASAAKSAAKKAAAPAKEAPAPAPAAAAAPAAPAPAKKAPTSFKEAVKEAVKEADK